MNRPMYLCVDYDDTLFIRESWRHFKGRPNKPIVDLVKALQKRNWKIILWTSRNGEALEKAKGWCKSQGIRIDYVNENPEAIQWFKEQLGFVNSAWSNKAFADVYIDDSAFNPDLFCHPNEERLTTEEGVELLETFCEDRFRKKVLGEKK